jgi:hypothetical protein
MSHEDKEQLEKMLDLVKEVKDQKESERALNALEEARRAIQARGQFIPKPPRSRKSIRVCF